MKTNTPVYQELQELGATFLTRIGNAMPYELPAQYFEILQSAQSFWMKETVEDEVPSFGKIKPAAFVIPAHYFEEQLNHALAAVQEVPAFATGTAPLQVPEGYFDNFPKTMLDKAKASELRDEKLTTKTVNFRPVYPARRTLRLAAAVIAFLLVGLGVMKYLPQGNVAPTETVQIQPLSASGAELALDTQASDLDALQKQMMASEFSNDLPMDVKSANPKEFSKEEIFEFLTGDEDNNL